MVINVLMKDLGYTNEFIAKEVNQPIQIIEDLRRRKIKLNQVPLEVTEKIAETLGVTVQMLLDDEQREIDKEKAFEYGLPGYLQKDLDAYKEGLKSNSSLIDCLWCELYGSINIAVINDGVITEEHADYLRQKFLFGGDN